MHPAFEVYKLNEFGIARAGSIAGVFDEALNRLQALCGVEGREMAIVRTKLEEACFFAKKAMASQPENQEGGE